MNFVEYFPDREALLASEPEDLAGLVVRYLTAPTTSLYQHSLQNFLNQNTHINDEDLRRTLTEAWMWLEKEVFLAPKPSAPSWIYVTKRGLAFSDKTSFSTYLKAKLLPRNLLHPSIAEKSFAMFIRGDYDTAVFQSFKDLEVLIRAAGGFEAKDVGVDLARRAFKPETGPLSDRESVFAEQEALMHLVSGAIGSYKNPHSHRNVQIDAGQAIEMIILASHLMGIIEKRTV